MDHERTTFRERPEATRTSLPPYIYERAIFGQYGELTASAISIARQVEERRNNLWNLNRVLTILIAAWLATTRSEPRGRNEA
jgi:hypothetical protein